MTSDDSAHGAGYDPAAVDNEYEGVVYDLDGTLVSLSVDWGAVARDVQAVYAEAGVDHGGHSLWDLLETAPDHGIEPAVEAAIASHEREGAAASDRLPLAEAVAAHRIPVAVCSLNCEAACRIALDTHDLTRGVRTVVGRDTVATKKPHPDPLLHAARGISVSPERVLFVGDSERDAVTAERAGTAFRYVDGGPSDH